MTIHHWSPSRPPPPMPARSGVTDTCNAAQAIDRILARFVRYHPDRIDLSLDRMYRLLSDLGDPHTQLPPVIHVAGTNGKGSTVAFLRAALEASGRTVSSYTSPHLVRFAERYRLAGAIPKDIELLSLFEEVEAINAGKAITEFEITTAAGLLAISRTHADIAILEVGLGGRFDATNVIDKPLATVIMRIAMDHMGFLGDTIGAIAAEKAAIQKPGVPSIVGPQEPAALDVISRTAETNRAVLYRAGVEWSFTPDENGNGGVYQGPETAWHLPAPALPGRHQLDNAATAAACLDICNLSGMDEMTVGEGLRTANWPGRLQRVTDGSLVGMLPDTWELWVDAAHNPSGAQAAAEMFAALMRCDPRTLHLVLAMASDKNTTGVLSAFAGIATSITTLPINNAPHMRSPESLADEARKLGIPSHSADSLGSALESLASEVLPARVLITGSHLLVGAALSINAVAVLDQ